MGKIKAFFRNKWVGFTLASLLYTLWFVVWTGNLWMLLGLVVIFDLYISKFFYRYVWCHNVRLCQRSKTYKTVYEWVNAIIFATVVASLVHIFIFQMYVIPTSSMEKSLLIGDYLYVSKVAYGPQMPNEDEKIVLRGGQVAVPPAQGAAQDQTQRRGSLQFPGG